MARAAASPFIPASSRGWPKVVSASMAMRCVSSMAMAQGEALAAVAISTSRSIRSGSATAHSTAWNPPTELPTSVPMRPMPSASASSRCARTMSRIVKGGKSLYQGRPVAGFTCRGPVVP